MWITVSTADHIYGQVTSKHPDGWEHGILERLPWMVRMQIPDQVEALVPDLVGPAVSETLVDPNGSPVRYSFPWSIDLDEVPQTYQDILADMDELDCTGGDVAWSVARLWFTRVETDEPLPEVV